MGDERYLRRAVEAAKRNGTPFGAVIFDPKSGETLAEAANDGPNPVRHAETAAIYDLAGRRPDVKWQNLTLYTTAEPCPMCAGAILWSGIRRVVFGTRMETLERLGLPQIGIPLKEVSGRADGTFPNLELTGGVLEEECDALFRPSGEVPRREVHALNERPDLEAAMRRLDPMVLPEFMHHSPVDERYWSRLYEEFPECQIAVCEGGEVAAAGYAIPLSWKVENLPDAGWDAALERGFRDREEGKPSNLLCALLVVVDAPRQRRGLSRKVLEAMREVAAKRGLGALVAPVRPSLKERYPITPMERYVGWRREDGLLFEPWMRAHERLGAEVVKVAPRSMEITGTVAGWEGWTGMSFPESGEYVVPGALVPVEMDLERDFGRYVEPDVWMLHRV